MVCKNLISSQGAVNIRRGNKSEHFQRKNKSSLHTFRLFFPRDRGLIKTGHFLLLV